MSDELPHAAERIANDYVDRLSDRLKGMPVDDRNELLGEIRSHIYDSYMNETTGDEIERILMVLRKLGEPADAISSHMSQAVEKLGKSRKAPLYILAAVLIAVFAVPLGLGAIGALIGLLAALFALVVTYYGLGVTLVVSGFLSGIICFVVAIDPGFVERINYALNMDFINFGPFAYDPQLGAALGLIISLILLGLGLLVLWSGKYIWRGFRFVTVLITQKVTRTFRHFARAGSPR